MKNSVAIAMKLISIMAIAIAMNVLKSTLMSMILKRDNIMFKQYGNVVRDIFIDKHPEFKNNTDNIKVLKNGCCLVEVGLYKPLFYEGIYQSFDKWGVKNG